MLNVGSLFSGIGGIELGMEAAGFTTLWFVECEPHAQALLRKHWPGAQVYADITQVDFRQVPRIDILTGGFPCQDISNAGKRAGISGSRSSLWKHYLRAICEIRPRYCLIENVAALRNRGLEVVLADLAQVGYDAEWHIISASSVGALHRRERLFIIAYPQCGGCDSGGFNQGGYGVHCQGQQDKEAHEVRTGYGVDSGKACSDVANSNSGNVERFGKSREIGGSCGKSQNKLSSSGYDRGVEEGRGIWSVEPCVGRVADGVSLRVDRIKRLGNAVVPQLAEVIAQAIKRQEGIEVDLSK